MIGENMFVYLEEFTVRLEDIVKVVPCPHESGGTYIYVQRDGHIDRERTDSDYKGVIEAIKIVESRKI